MIAYVKNQTLAAFAKLIDVWTSASDVRRWAAEGFAFPGERHLFAAETPAAKDFDW